MTKVKSRGAQGGGSIRKRPDGRWEARYTTGFDHKTGRQIQRSIYGKIVAEADRVIDAGTIIRRTVQYGLTRYPELGAEEQIARAETHLAEKYGPGGYLRLWIPWSGNASRLEDLRALISDAASLHAAVSRVFFTLCIHSQ